MSFRKAFLFTNNLVVECIGRVKEIEENHPEIVPTMPRWELHKMPKRWNCNCEDCKKNGKRLM